MATVTSLTETRIQELLAGWEGIGLNQDEINSLVILLRETVLMNASEIDTFVNYVTPQIQADMAANSAEVTNLRDVTMPQLQDELEAAQSTLATMVNITIPSLTEDLDATITNVNERPKVYVQPEAPEDPDEEERFLVVGDTWFDSDDMDKHHVWNGVEWTTLSVDVADFSLTVRKFLTTKHQIY